MTPILFAFLFMQIPVGFDPVHGHAFFEDFLRNSAYFWIISAFISTMPQPGPNAAWPLRWAHDFMQVIGANLNKVGGRKIDPIFRNGEKPQ